MAASLSLGAFGAGRKENENETDHLLNGEINVYSAFLKVNKSVEAQTGPTARLLHFEAQGESEGDQILDLSAEKVDDAGYLLQAMGLPEEQVYFLLVLECVQKNFAFLNFVFQNCYMLSQN